MLTRKSCTKCGVVKEAAAFQKRPRVRSGLASWCRKCLNRHNNAKGPTRRAAAKKRLIALRGGKCESCRGVFPHYVYDFHHLDPAQKDINMNDLHDKRWERVLAEVAKCALLCANCHRIAHHAGKP